MRIIFVTSKLNFVTAGGSITDLYLKAENLQKLGHEVKVVTVYSHKNKIDKALPYSVVAEQFKTFHQLPVQYQIWQRLKKYSSQADIFHVEGQYMYGAGLYRLFGGKIPVVAFYNREFISWPSEDGQKEKQFSVLKRLKNRLRYLAEKYLGGNLANRLDFFIFTTPFIQQAYYNFGLSPKVPSRIMLYFVDDRRLLSAAGMAMAEILEKRQATKKIVQLYCTGRMIKEKGFDLVLKAFSLLTNKDKFRLVLGGDGPERDSLIKMAKDLGLENYVEFPGWVDYQAMVHFLVESDIFIVPRWRRECSAVIGLEAMTLGLPTLVFSGGGLEWIVGNPNLTFKTNDQADLAQKISALGTDNALRLRLGQHCFRRMSGVFHYSKLAQELEAIIFKLTN